MVMTVESLNLPAPAKLNLFLHVLGRRKDGYHDIQTVFQFVDFHDELQFSLLDHAAIEFASKGDTNGLSQQDNLVLQAAQALQQHTHCEQGAKITLLKRLPIGGGVGGGSSDAATTLLGLSRLWDVNVPLDELMVIGRKLGADVPIFLSGHTAWAEGIGDQLTQQF